MVRGIRHERVSSGCAVVAGHSWQKHRITVRYNSPDVIGLIINDEY